MRAQGLFHTPDAPEADVLGDAVSLILATVEPSVAGPKRPQDRVLLSNEATQRRSRRQLPHRCWA